MAKGHKKTNSDRFFPRWKRLVSYAAQNVFNNVRQNILATLLTILVIAISITLPTVFYVLLKNVNEAAQQWYPTPNLTTYLVKNATNDQIDNLKNQISAFDEVQEIIYLSKEEALEEFRVWSGFSDALDLLDNNPLPPVIIAIPKDDAKQTNILHQLQKQILQLDTVDDVRLDDSWFTRLTALTDMIKTIVLTLSILMLVAVSLVIGNSIRLMIFARRQTIHIMQLIGATEGFILRPFLYSGMFHGFLSAIVALILSEIFVYKIDSMILNVSSVFGTVFNIRGLIWEENLFIILVCTIIGWLSAWVATKKHLKASQDSR